MRTEHVYFEILLIVCRILFYIEKFGYRKYPKMLKLVLNIVSHAKSNSVQYGSDNNLSSPCNGTKIWSQSEVDHAPDC